MRHFGAWIPLEPLQDKRPALLALEELGPPADGVWLHDAAVMLAAAERVLIKAMTPPPAASVTAA
jgi:hypothetical protein